MHNVASLSAPAFTDGQPAGLPRAAGWVYHIECAPSWGELTERLHERDRQGWEVVNFLTREQGFIAFLRRSKDLERDSTVSRA